MHTFGFPARLEEIAQICQQYQISLVEDAAESLGSFYKDQHTGVLGKTAAISFNGNKIITTGGGGMLLTNDAEIAKRAKHITTTAKVPHKWAFEHDEVGYNYRLPNLNAALGVAQMESLSGFVSEKRDLAAAYQQWGSENSVQFVKESINVQANYWLNTLVAEDKQARNEWLRQTNELGVMTRPIWDPMHYLDINKSFVTDSMGNTKYLFDRLVNVPSGTFDRC